mmetsp:Transcript_16677/g.47880  ORF Transcript_16677/g.47880 Transcript_16677/m.47880 type:complete len:530 (+) Transcript_16677:458-2047(+)|eukprot:CAMPEP_0181061132 /NCGR_PEP_ID=MMETSP1070-20121207/22350_1 /TAXON_ID=265543 /ORGANISM="Minutocellus polymorphus, Strain NH13" /LENGTH=529 /DNA_ID=CAMNT_0023141051 /DNA_START=440 /DNA_END=2029 /DNA_ORIENTATION=+
MVKVDQQTLDFMKEAWKAPIDYDSEPDEAVPQSPAVLMSTSSETITKKKKWRLKKARKPSELSAKPMLTNNRVQPVGNLNASSVKLEVNGWYGYYTSTKKKMPAKKPEPKINKNDASKMVEPPPENKTGVDPAILQIAACLSQQIYDATDETYFHLEATAGDAEMRKGEVHIFNSHGSLNPAIPAFAVASVGTTLILGWRGTNQILDFINDAAFAPVVSRELVDAATGIRSHAMFSACVGSALRVHEDEIISLIEEKSIDTIVFTGHSLGGALAHVAHLFIQASIGIQDEPDEPEQGGFEGSVPWKKTLSHLKEPLKLKTVSFAAPMSTIDRENVLDRFDEFMHNIQADTLLEVVSSNSVNFVFSCDVVPRAYGHIFYINDVIRAIGPELVRNHVSQKLSFFDYDEKISTAVIDFILARTEPLVDVAASFRHYGALLYYGDLSTTTPTEIEDKGPALLKRDSDDNVIICDKKPIIERSENEQHFNHYAFDQYEMEKDAKGRPNYVATLLKAHSHFPMSFAPFISEKVDP